jgi:hypothetical protein
MTELGLADLRRLRVGAHLLDPGRTAAVADVTTHLGALQAQDRTATLWSLGLRAGVGVTEVESAVEARQVVRTWPMRGTLHWVPAEDARWMCRTMSGPAARAARRVREQRGLSDAVLDRAAAVLDDALAGGPLPRPEVYAAWEQAGLRTDQQRGYNLLVILAEAGLVVQAGTAGKQPTFALLDRWVPSSRDLEGEEALAVAVERYVRGHGPVHAKDVAGWWGGTLREVRTAVAALGPRLATVTHDGSSLLVHAEAEPPAGPVTVLLPAFDEYLLGHKDRSAVLAPEHARAVVPGGNGVFLGTLLVDGGVLGTWRRQERRDRVEVTLSPFAPLPARVARAVEAAVSAYGEFVGLEAVLV